MRRVLLLLLTLPVIITACLSDGSDEPRVTIEPTSSPFAPLPLTAAVTATTSSTSTETAAPATSTTPPTAVEVVAATPSADVCLHSHPYFRPEFFTMNADGTEVRKIIPEGMIEAWEPAWSPDGTRLAFAGYDGHNDGIFVMDLDGTNVRRLTNGDGTSTEPAWSPDGRHIVFVRQLPDPGGEHLYVIDSDGSNLRQLTSFAGFVSAPDWSPDGARIAFASDQSGNDEIYVVGADGERLAQLTDRPTWDYAPVWSADGQRIVFRSDYFSTDSQFADESEIGTFTMNADGSDIQRVDVLAPADSEPRWSPNGGQIAFVRDFEIMLVDSAGGVRRNLTQHPLADERPRWSPDGQSILFVSQRELWPLAEPGPGQPEAVVLRAGERVQEGGFGTNCESFENGFRAMDVFGVWLPPEPLVTEPGTSPRFDFSALPELSAFEIVLYDYEEALRVGKLVEGVLTPPCAPPGGAETACLKERVTGSSSVVDIPDLPPGHYAIIVRANFGTHIRGSYTEQGFNLIVRG